MITHSGEGNESLIRLALLGDGTATSVDIDLTQPPYNLSFGTVFPDNFTVYMEDGIKPSNAVLASPGASAILHFDFPEALPAPTPGTASPRTQMRIYLFYP